MMMLSLGTGPLCEASLIVPQPLSMAVDQWRASESSESNDSTTQSTSHAVDRESPPAHHHPQSHDAQDLAIALLARLLKTDVLPWSSSSTSSTSSSTSAGSVGMSLFPATAWRLGEQAQTGRCVGEFALLYPDGPGHKLFHPPRVGRV
jgi:hypothetical protein